MREHVMAEADTDKDDTISVQEFANYVRSPSFLNLKKDGWTPIMPEKEYTPEQLEAYERKRAEALKHPTDQINDELKDASKALLDEVHKRAKMRLNRAKLALAAKEERERR